MTPFFSVVITVYNKAKHIKNTLNSVLNQTFDDFEVIIVDDGSTDNSEHIIKSFDNSRIKLITTANKGAASARNRGIKESKSNYIALLDGDDEWHKDYLNEMKAAIENYDSHKVFVCAVAQKYDSKIVPLEYSANQTELYGIHNYFRASRRHTIITSSSVVFHKSILENTGVFDTSIVSGEDVDLWVRFGIYYDIVFVNKLMVNYNYDSNSLSNTTFELNKKPKYDKYYEEEQKNKDLKAYLDLNRYSLAILSKLQNDKDSYKFYTSRIDKKNISLRQYLLLKSPKWLLKLLLSIKSLKGEKLYYSDAK